MNVGSDCHILSTWFSLHVPFLPLSILVQSSHGHSKLLLFLLKQALMLPAGKDEFSWVGGQGRLGSLRRTCVKYVRWPKASLPPREGTLSYCFLKLGAHQ